MSKQLAVGNKDMILLMIKTHGSSDINLST